MFGKNNKKMRDLEQREKVTLFHQYYLYFICSKFSKKKKKKDKFVAIPFVFFLYHYPCLIPDSLRLSKMAHVNIDFYLIYVNNSEVKPLQL